MTNNLFKLIPVLCIVFTIIFTSCEKESLLNSTKIESLAPNDSDLKSTHLISDFISQEEILNENYFNNEPLLRVEFDKVSEAEDKNFSLKDKGRQIQIPDNNFEQALIDLGVDGVLDDLVYYNNIKNITELYIVNRGISNLEGIEYFKKLNYINCSQNNIKHLDFSKNEELEELNCRTNVLETLNISKNENLKYLRVGGIPGWINVLEELDVTKNENLEELYCFFNQLKTLDISKNKKLTKLYCRDNQLSQLNLSQNNALTVLTCSFNNIQSLDVSNNPALVEFYPYFNPITKLDLSQNTELQRIWVNNCNLESLNVKNGTNTKIFDFRAFENPNLECIQVDEVDFSNDNWFDIDAAAYFSVDCGY